MVLPLWRHQQSIVTSSAERNRAIETRRRCMKIVVFIVIDAFVISCKKYNNVCTLVTTRLSARWSAILGVYFPQETHIKITLWWGERINSSPLEYIQYFIYVYRNNTDWDFRSTAEEAGWDIREAVLSQVPKMWNLLMHLFQIADIRLIYDMNLWWVVWCYAGLLS